MKYKKWRKNGGASEKKNLILICLLIYLVFEKIKIKWIRVHLRGFFKDQSIQFVTVHTEILDWGKFTYYLNHLHFVSENE